MYSLFDRKIILKSISMMLTKVSLKFCPDDQNVISLLVN